MSLQEQIDVEARKAGFAQAGIAPVEPPVGQKAEYLEEWIAAGFAGEMDYLKRRDAEGTLLRASVSVVLPWARSIIVCAAPYDADAALSIEPAPATAGWIARYAWSGRAADDQPNAPSMPSDYHKVLLRRLQQLEAALHAALEEPFTSRAWVDTGPLVERSYAQAAGLGWTAKNTCTLSQTLGSFFFLGVIATSLAVDSADQLALPADRCGSCTRCLDVCPTNALPAPRQMDASRCISYLTIEKRGPIPHELRAGMGRQIFGCDICQDVCPWNGLVRKRRAGSPPGSVDAFAGDPELMPRRELINPDLGALAAMTEEEYGRMFYGSPVNRTKFKGLRRNIAIAMGNSGCADFMPRLREWASDQDPVLAESAAWAIQRLAATVLISDEAPQT